MNTRRGWKVLRAGVSKQNGGLFVEGENHESTDPLFKTFGWHIHRESLRDSRFDFSGTTWSPGARAVYEQLTQ